MSKKSQYYNPKADMKPCMNCGKIMIGIYSYANRKFCQSCSPQPIHPLHADKYPAGTKIRQDVEC